MTLLEYRNRLSPQSRLIVARSKSESSKRTTKDILHQKGSIPSVKASYKTPSSFHQNHIQRTHASKSPKQIDKHSHHKEPVH